MVDGRLGSPQVPIHGDAYEAKTLGRVKVKELTWYNA